MVPPFFLLLSKTLRGKSFVILNLAVRRKLGTKAKPFMEFQIVVLEYYHTCPIIIRGLYIFTPFFSVVIVQRLALFQITGGLQYDYS